MSYEIYRRGEKSFQKSREVLNRINEIYNVHYTALIDKRNHENTEFLVKCIVISEVFYSVNQAALDALTKDSLENCGNLDDVLINLIKSLTEIVSPGRDNEETGPEDNKQVDSTPLG